MRSLAEGEAPSCEDPSGRRVTVGRRVRVGGFRATVEYVGPVEGTRGTWLGLRWDDAGRGKHDGSAGGVRYFSSPGDNSASFVRPQKLDACATCSEAIKGYYAEKEDEPSAALHRAVIEDWKKKIKVPFIQMVGFESVEEKQSTLDRLLEACVSDRCIYTAGDLINTCPSLNILDISRNLFDNWNSVAEIVVQLQHLYDLNLSKNRITNPSDEEAIQLSSCFRNIKILSMTNSDLDWNHVSKLALMFMNVEEIILAYNNISKIPESICDEYFAKLNSIVLDGNPIESWSEILKLGHLPELKTLSLNDCRLRNIFFDNNVDDEKSDLFSEVETIHLKENSIDNWRSISELNKLKNLQKLYFTKNPLITLDSYDTCSQFIIARIGNLKELNASEITREIRRGAEYDYIKKHGLEWKHLQENNEELRRFSLENSRFTFLIKKHGLPDDTLLVTKTPSWAINANLLEIFVRDESSGGVVKKKLPASMTVQKLIALARKLFAAKTKAANSSCNPELVVCHENEDGGEVRVRLDNQMKELSYYSVLNGDTIAIKW